MQHRSQKRALWLLRRRGERRRAAICSVNRIEEVSMTARLDLRNRSASIAAISIACRFVVVVVSLAGSPRAYAQSAEAEAMFDEGKRLMTERKLAQACEAFEASNRIEPRAGTLILLGDCCEQNQQLASAWSAYK